MCGICVYVKSYVCVLYTLSKTLRGMNVLLFTIINDIDVSA